MQKRTKIILASTAAAIVLIGAIGASKAREGFQKGYHGGPSYMQHARFGGHGKGMGGPFGMADKVFDKFDVDKNGTITKTEIDGVRKNELAKNDANKDGKLSLNEFQTLWTGLMRERMVDHFQRLDSDGDAVVTEEEIAKPMDRIMSFMDRNNDGSITKDELQRKHRGWGQKWRGRHHDDHDDDDDDDKKTK
ncbi:MAG: EF-hand domain-containing protein [Rhodospirillales bacterium]|jgi:hypothetical protein|nr:EF-hand domain-containing protein [Rhodospirillales bacterium]MDP7424242.1 EF-hand domain-containing protein [Rhodospirillales bacterium]MDP7600499.1 EF-hand domain-containing protein [Rhodospirillales bacterium]HJL66989.1 EF-hand domain-containing protein [Arenicellales bacterium]HJP26979.1 EF-hand domain-containing protein [Arenicellales bacterium]|tara:strand:+ start:341 stop:916 length:576 start_codon:yes stop_codon:yes gene_type:complete